MFSKIFKYLSNYYYEMARTQLTKNLKLAVLETFAQFQNYSFKNNFELIRKIAKIFSVCMHSI